MKETEKYMDVRKYDISNKHDIIILIYTVHKGLLWRSGQSARLSPLRLRVRFSERTFSMLLEPSAPLM